MKTELKQSSVVFNEEQHTYWLGEKQLSGITSIIKKYIFPDMYSGVSEKILKKAAERGTRAHFATELWTMGILSEEDEKELRPMIDAIKAEGLNVVENEYLVSDNAWVASSIDLVMEDEEQNVILGDLKTTSVLNMEYLQWQLSIYAFLFEMQNPELKVSRLKAVHLRNGVCKIVNIERLPDPYILALLNTYASGYDTFENPLHEMPTELDELLAEYADNELALAEIDGVKKPLDEKKKQLQESIAAILKEKGLQKIETDAAKVTVSADSSRESFDLKAFRDSDSYKTMPEAFAPFIKSTTTKGRITITIK